MSSLVIDFILTIIRSNMNVAIWGFIGTFLGVIIGSSTSIITTIFNNRNASKIQSDAEKLKQAGRFREFQFETIISLQTHIVTSMRFVGKAHLENLKNFIEHGKIGKLSEPLNEDLREAFQDLSILIERINSDELRAKLLELNSEMHKCQFATSRNNAEELFHNCVMNFKIVSPEIGKELRSTYK